MSYYHEKSMDSEEDSSILSFVGDKASTSTQPKKITKKVNPQRESYVRKKTAGWTKNKLRNLDKITYTIDTLATKGLSYFLTLTIENEVSAEEMKHLIFSVTRYMRRCDLYTWLYTIEWEKHQKCPHLHFFINTIHEKQITDIKNFWLKNTKHLHSSARKQNVRVLGKNSKNIKKVLGYMRKRNTKIINSGFSTLSEQAQKEWSKLSLYSCSKHWVTNRKTSIMINKTAKNIIVRTQKTHLIKAVNDTPQYFTALNAIKKHNNESYRPWSYDGINIKKHLNSILKLSLDKIRKYEREEYKMSDRFVPCIANKKLLRIIKYARQKIRTAVVKNTFNELVVINHDNSFIK